MFNTTFRFLFLSLLCFSANAQPIDPARIEIARDAWGIAHIYAPTDPEVAYGLAWAQAEDKFTLVQQTFLLAKGMLGEVYGKQAVAGDFFMHATGVADRVDAQMAEEVSPEFLRYLGGFCQGVNAYAEAHPKEVLHKDLFPVTPREVLIGYAVKIADFVGYSNVVGRIVSGRYDGPAEKAQLQMKGSNAFSFSSKLTKDGRTYLIINPHVQLDGQESFYEIHVNSEEGLNFHGAMFPGSVAPQLGTNPHLGWGHTNNYFDITDVFALKMNPANPLQYEMDDEWVDLEVKEVKLRVKMAGIKIGVKRKIYQSKYGPVFESEGGNMMAAATPAIFTIKAPEQWFRMIKATHLQAFKQALEWDGLPYFNITYADKEDNVFYIYNGHFPVRNPGYDWAGVVPGNTSQTLWQGYVPLDERPQFLNPDCGYVYNVNHNPFKCTCEESWPDPARYDTLVDYDYYDDLTRSLRFREAYNDGTRLNMEELKAIKYDATFPRTETWTQVIQRMQKLDPEVHAAAAPAIREIRDWDLNVRAESTAPTLIYLMYRAAGRKGLNDTEALAAKDETLSELLVDAQNHLLQYVGFVNVPWGQFCRMQRGDKSLPAYGFPGLLAARFVDMDNETGKLTATGGDSFMMFVQYDKDGVQELESIVPYGNSDRPDSPHYNDQMEIYAAQKAKKLTFDKAEILRNARKVYHPQ